MFEYSQLALHIAEGGHVFAVFVPSLPCSAGQPATFPLPMLQLLSLDREQQEALLGIESQILVQRHTMRGFYITLRDPAQRLPPAETQRNKETSFWCY